MDQRFLAKRSQVVMRKVIGYDDELQVCEQVDFEIASKWLDISLLSNNMPAKTKESAAVAAPSNPIIKPNWPPFKPLLPTSDLSLEVVAPNQIVTISNFWTSTLCKTYVS